MEMGDGFSAVGAVVDDEAVAAGVQFQLAGDFLGGGEKVAEDGVVFRGDSGVAGVVLFGDEEDMNGGLGGDIAEGEDLIVLVEDVGGKFAVDDPLEDRFGHGPSYQMVNSRSWGPKWRARARMKWTISSLRR